MGTGGSGRGTGTGSGTGIGSGGSQGGGFGNLPSKFTVQDLIKSLKSEPLFSDIISKPGVEDKLKLFINTEMRVKGLSAEELWTNPSSIQSWLERAVMAAEKAGDKSKGFLTRVGDFMESSVSSRRAKQSLVVLILMLLAGVITLTQLKNKAKEIIGTDTPEENTSTEDSGTSNDDDTRTP
jgi:hypothetical protein